MLGTMVKVRPRYWIAISAVLALAVLSGLAMACHRKPATLPPPSLAASSPTQSQPGVDAKRVLDPTFLVLASMGSTPPGARIVRVSDGVVLGVTPETLEFHQSDRSVMVRFELDGYIPVTDEVPMASDSVFRIVLEPIPAKVPHRARSAKH